MSATVRDLLLRRADDHHPALLFEELRWSWQEYVEHAARTCHAMAGLFETGRPRHVGALLDNVPEMAVLLGVRAERGTAYSRRP